MRQFDPTIAVEPLPVRCRGVDGCTTPRRTGPPVSGSWRRSRRLINRPWMSGDRFALRLRRVGGDGDPGGMRFARPTGDSSVSCRDSLATRERPLQVPRLFSLLTRAFSLLSLSLFSLLSCPSLYLSLPSLANPTRDSRDARSRECATTCIFSSLPPVSEPVACVLRFLEI